MLKLSYEISNRRKLAKLSLNELGKMSGVSDTTIRKIEKEESKNIRWDTVCSLAKALNFTEEEFLELAGYLTPVSKVVTQNDNYDNLNDSERKEVDLFIEFLLHRRKLIDDEKEAR